MALDEGAELDGRYHAAQQLARLGEIGPAQGRAIDEPEGEPVAQLPRPVGRWPSNRGAHDQAHQGLDVRRLGDGGANPHLRCGRLAALHVDGPNLAADVEEVTTRPSARVPPGLVEEDP